MKRILSFVFLLGIFLIPMLSASGLEITQSEINVTKDFQLTKIVELTVKNTENKNLFNIQFEEDNIIEVTPFNLTSGETKNVSARIITNNDFSGELTLRGDYETQLGQSNKTEIVNIDYTYGIDNCDFELIVGDSVKWINNVLDEVTLTNVDTNQDFKTILEGENWTKKFEYVEELSYVVKRIGVPFTDTCTINTRSDDGYAHSDEYDAKINANIKINYDPTEISLEYLETNYTIVYNGQEEDFLKIKNIGSNPGKNIKLEGEWVEFTENNFDLSQGYSKTIEFKINPEIFETNQTNRTYDLDIRITGNFDPINATLHVFVPYKKLTDIFSDGSVDTEVIRNFFKFWCKENPEDEICESESANINGSTTNIQFSTDTIKQLIERIANNEDEQEIYQKIDLEFKQNQSNITQAQNEEISALRVDQQRTNELIEKQNSTMMFLLIFILSIAAGLVMIKLYFSEGFRKITLNKLKMRKEELL